MNPIQPLFDAVKPISEFTGEKFINELSMIGTIAGGSILACYDRDQKVNDIDFYVDTNEKMHETVIFLEKHLDIELFELNNSIIQVSSTGGNPKIQIIKVIDANPMTIIKEFDFDFVRGAYHKKKPILTDEFLESVKTKEIKVYRLQHNVHRINKCIKKGYKMPKFFQTLHDLKYDYDRVFEYQRGFGIDDILGFKFEPLTSNSYAFKNDIEIINYETKTQDEVEMKLYEYDTYPTEKSVSLFISYRNMWSNISVLKLDFIVINPSLKSGYFKPSTIIQYLSSPAIDLIEKIYGKIPLTPIQKSSNLEVGKTYEAACFVYVEKDNGKLRIHFKHFREKPGVKQQFQLAHPESLVGTKITLLDILGTGYYTNEKIEMIMLDRFQTFYLKVIFKENREITFEETPETKYLEEKLGKITTFAPYKNVVEKFKVPGTYKCKVSYNLVHYCKKDAPEIKVYIYDFITKNTDLSYTWNGHLYYRKHLAGIKIAWFIQNRRWNPNYAIGRKHIEEFLRKTDSEGVIDF